ncbi:hypothetical protein [Leptospira perolatii]|uniref:hypothetical protein n=1 Tax=Leptospira perolatii TaxID=2023191 RepID=UPI001A9CB547|nr:hypothetical protein [Leptospira perolatii]
MQLNSNEFKNLLHERTVQFRNSVDFKKPYTMAEYRKQRESSENNIPRKDPLTYNCPFLGILPGHEEDATSDRASLRARIGCMIHPIYSGDPKSQNYSFYGASICQTYDCRNKERSTSDQWEVIFSEIASDTFSYSSLASDYKTIELIEGYLKEQNIPETEWFERYRDSIKGILKRKLELGVAKWNTSFELEMESPPPISFADRLKLWLGEIPELKRNQSLV